MARAAFVHDLGAPGKGVDGLGHEAPVEHVARGFDLALAVRARASASVSSRVQVRASAGLRNSLRASGTAPPGR